MMGVKSATGSIVLAPTNQQDSISDQFDNGVGGLMLDMYDFLNGIWFVTLLEVNTSTLQLSPELVDCLSCTPASQRPAINVLREIQQFLEANPTEILTIIIEDYVSSVVGNSGF